MERPGGSGGGRPWSEPERGPEEDAEGDLPVAAPVPRSGRAQAPVSRRPPIRSVFGVGEIFSRTLGVWFSRLHLFILFTAVLFLPLFVWLYLSLNDPTLALDDDEALETGGRAAVMRVALMSAVGDVLGTVLSSVAAAAFAYTVMKRLQRQSAPFAACVSMGFSRLPSVLGVALVVGTATGLIKVPAAFLAPGNSAVSLLFNLGSLVLTILWSAAVPAAVVERLGVGAALARSVSLTQGYRWSIFFAWFLIGLVVGMGLTVLLMFVIAGVARGLDEGDALKVGLLVGGVLAAVVGSIQAVGATVVYHGLRQTKEGLTADDLVKSFE